MDELYIDGLEQALSLERFGRYLTWAGGNRLDAVNLYTLNTQLSECLYTPLQMLEVSLRNRIHAVLSEASGNEWYNDPNYQLIRSQSEQLTKAQSDVRQAPKQVTPGRVVAALTFGYWTTFFNKKYEELWRHHLHKIIINKPAKLLIRKAFSSQLTPIRRLRNRIAHHEPILDQDLSKIHSNILQLTKCLSPAAAQWCEAHCRFSEVYLATGIVLQKKQPNGPLPDESIINLLVEFE